MSRIIIIIIIIIIIHEVLNVISKLPCWSGGMIGLLRIWRYTFHIGGSELLSSREMAL